MNYKVGDKVIYMPAAGPYTFYDEFTITRVGKETVDVARQILNNGRTIGEWKRVQVWRLYPHSEDLYHELRRLQEIKSDHLRAVHDTNDVIQDLLDTARRVVKANA